LPDGRAAIDPRDGTTVLPKHLPYVIVIAATAKTINWTADHLAQGMAFLPIDPGATLTFDNADKTGVIDDTEYRNNMYSWSVLDADFKIANISNPQGAIAIAAVKQGTLRLYRLKKAEALVAQLDVQTPKKVQTITVTLKTGGTTRSVTVPIDSEIVVANVSEDRITGTGSSEKDADHFYIYYVLNTGGKKPTPNLPQPNTTAKESVATHPFLQPGRDIHVSCSPTNFQ